MKTSLGYTIVKARKSFNHYLKHVISYAKYYYGSYPYRVVHDDNEFDIITSCISIMELDKEFKTLLNKEELEAIQYTSYHNPDTRKPSKYEKCMSSAYEKWLRIFFRERESLYEDINPVKLGMILKYIRISNSTKKTELAKMIGVDRITVSRIEEGKRLPTLCYIFKFSKIYHLNVDELINRVFA